MNANEKINNLENMAGRFVRRLAEETDAFRKSEAFREYLNTMAKFWRYSYRNQILIHVQNQNATRVAGFRKWNELGRRIKAGSKAIKILAPYEKKFVEKDAQTGEEKEVMRTLFWPVSVFDVSQTSGRPLPKIDVELRGDSSRPLLDKLLSFCSSSGIKVEFKELGVNGLYGYSRGGKIAICSDKSANTQANVLIHEIAHELTHYTKAGRKFSKNEKEIHAEAATYVVTRALGIGNKSANYLALYANDKAEILGSIEIISKTAKRILEAVG